MNALVLACSTYAPTTYPTAAPITKLPTSQPSRQPSRQPTHQPTSRPSHFPTTQPSRQPINHPSTQPTLQPFSVPTTQPTLQPTQHPSSPTGQPTSVPSHPTYAPTLSPSTAPTITPTLMPSLAIPPSYEPSYSPVTGGAVVNTVQVVQIVAGVISDSMSFRTSFTTAIQTLLSANSVNTVVNITSVSVVNVRRHVLAIGVLVTYEVTSTQSACTLASSLTTGTATLTANLQQTFPTASAMPPTTPLPCISIGPTTTASNTPLIAGVVGSIGGLLLLLVSSYGVYLYRKKKVVLVQTHATGDETVVPLDNVVQPYNLLGQSEKSPETLGTIAVGSPGGKSIDTGKSTGIDMEDNTLGQSMKSTGTYHVLGQSEKSTCSLEGNEGNAWGSSTEMDQANVPLQPQPVPQYLQPTTTPSSQFRLPPLSQNL